MPLQLRYFYGGEADQFNFYRIPKTLFTDRRFGKLSMEAKVLYGLLLDRMCLSTENGWFDGQGRVYIFFTLEDAMAMLGYGKDKLVRVFKELDVIGLIERKKQGLGRPTIIYVKNFVLPPEPAGPPTPDREPQNPDPEKTSGKPKSGPPDSQTSEKPKSGLRQDRSPDFAKADTNDTERNDTECSDTDLSIYTLAALYNAPLTMEQFFTMQAGYDMACGN